MEWGGWILFSHGTSATRGICICFKNGFYCNIDNIFTNFEGRVLCCDICLNPEDGNKMTICSIYAPNRDSPSFFDALGHRLADCTENIILLGDFNLVMNTKLDRYGSDHNNWKSLEKLQEVCEEFHLSDTWRVRNENTMRFSWTRRRPNFQASRIDFALASKGLEPNVDNICYLQSILTDHSALYLSINLSRQDRGPGYWKLNAKLLCDNDTLNAVRAAIVTEIAKCEGDVPADKKWASILKCAQDKLKQIAREQAAVRNIVISNLSEQLNHYEENLPLNEKEAELYDKTKLDLEELQLQRAEGLIFRSKVRWYEEGEKNSKYFYNLEKSRYNAKTCTRLFDPEDETQLISGATDILKLQESFYTQLYKKDPDVRFTLENKYGVQLSKESFQLCSRPVTLKEATEALVAMKNQRTPGDDGLPVEFYKIFWREMSGPFMSLMEYVF